MGGREQRSGDEPPEGASLWAESGVGDTRLRGCRSPVVRRIASKAEGKLRWSWARGGRERLARPEEAEALEDVLGGSVARYDGQDASAPAARAVPDVLSEGACLEGGPVEAGRFGRSDTGPGDRWRDSRASPASARIDRLGAFA